MEDNVSAVVGGLPAKVLWAGLTAGFVGLQQVNLEMPASLPSSVSVTLQLVMNGEPGEPYALAVH